MGANSTARRLVKRMLYPVLNEHVYQYLQAVSKAWDIRSGKWSEPEIELIAHAVRPGETALDLGANFGLYSYHLSRRVGPRGRVYAFEPVPFTYKTFTTVTRLLRFGHNVEIVKKGCSDHSGEVVFAVPVQASGATSAGQAYMGGRDDESEGKEQQVRWVGTRDVRGQVIALDEFLPQVANLSLIKCDIEGAELLAFRGAERLIDQHLPTIICEINPWFLEGFGIQLGELLGFFSQKNYELYHYRNEEGNRELRRVSVAEVEEDNYVFIHPSRRERFAQLLKE